jgi:hypothetical protein
MLFHLCPKRVWALCLELPGLYLAKWCCPLKFKTGYKFFGSI